MWPPSFIFQTWPQKSTILLRCPFCHLERQTFDTRYFPWPRLPWMQNDFMRKINRSIILIFLCSMIVHENPFIAASVQGAFIAVSAMGTSVVSVASFSSSIVATGVSETLLDRSSSCYLVYEVIFCLFLTAVLYRSME